MFAGDPRRQITILNARELQPLPRRRSTCWSAPLTGDRLVALLAALFHLASSFVMFLAIVNEDIMPSYTRAVRRHGAGRRLARPADGGAGASRSSVLFSLAWLMEWRLMFPTLPAMLAALWLCERRPARRLGWIALFLAAHGRDGRASWPGPGRATTAPSGRSS